MNGRVLILDDDSSVGETIGFVAETANLEARSVTTPEAFFVAIEEWQPTHIVLDLIMPEMDGVEIMQRLATQECQARLIILSGVGSRVLDAARRVAAERGLRIIGVLSKPISTRELRDFLSRDTESGDLPEGNGKRTKAVALTRDDLLAAIRERQFEVFYQPKISCSTSKTSGFEALVRWRHPQHGIIMPDAFISLAEQTNLIDEITEQILDEALAWMTGLPTVSGMSVSVNLSARTLKDPELADRLAKRCKDAGVDPGCIIFELTETTAMEDAVLALDLVTRLRMKGFHISIDDVGTGYSSMAQLARLPFSEMKVDKSFVMTATVSQESRTIVSSIIELGHKLDLRVVAEGVEDEATLDFLNRAGCDYVQGFYIAKPMPGEHVAAWIAGHD